MFSLGMRVKWSKNTTCVTWPRQHLALTAVATAPQSTQAAALLGLGHGGSVLSDLFPPSFSEKTSVGCWTYSTSTFPSVQLYSWIDERKWRAEWCPVLFQCVSNPPAQPVYNSDGMLWSKVKGWRSKANLNSDVSIQSNISIATRLHQYGTVSWEYHANYHKSHMVDHVINATPTCVCQWWWRVPAQSVHTSFRPAGTPWCHGNHPQRSTQ